MFLPPKRFAISCLALLAGFCLTQTVDAQSAQYEARYKALQAARNRAQQTQQTPTDAQVQQTTYEQGYDYSEPPRPPRSRVARLPQQAQRTAPQNIGRTTAARRVPATNRTYTPRHLRTAQVYDGQISEGGAPIANGAPIISDAPVVSNGCNCNGAGCSSCAGDVYTGVVDDCGCGSDCGGGCGIGIGCGVRGCGLNGLMCGRCYSCGPLEVPCSERGGCPPGTWENCWLFGLGAIFEKIDYSVGAVAFKGPAFNVGGQTLTDSNFGLYAGANVGVPLCRLTCGLFSGQIGVRTVQTNFNGTSFSADIRDQTFVTVGLYRRVDYGLQAGFVVDYLNEEWINNSEVSQFRGDVAWVYPNGATYGFRFASGLEDDVSSARINGTTINQLVTSTYDQYRFYYRLDCEAGGFTDIYAGWADFDRAVLGIDVDTPIAERVAIQAGINYLIADETPGVGNTDADSWNLYMGLAFRPRGINWYRYYDRPMFDVADNGTFLIQR